MTDKDSMIGRPVAVPNKYDFDKDKNRCPVCGGLGIPLHGWFTCEDCQSIAVIKTGATYVPLSLFRTEKQLRGDIVADLRRQLAEVTAHRDSATKMLSECRDVFVFTQSCISEVLERARENFHTVNFSMSELTDAKEDIDHLLNSIIWPDNAG